MRGGTPRIIRLRGKLTSIAELSKLSGINYQTLYDRWKRLGFPKNAPESMLNSPVQPVKSPGVVTLDGEPVSIRKLMQVAGKTSSTIYRIIREKGENLTTADIQTGRSRYDEIIIDIPAYDPSDRGPGYCERASTISCGTQG